MRRGSLIGPVILILIGVIFLVNNMMPELPVWQFVADYWPFLLIAWGVIRALEVLFLGFTGRPLPRSGISGGEWILAIFLTVFGSLLFVGHRMGERFPHGRITARGLEILGESYDFSAEAAKAAGKAPKVVIENPRGNARIAGGDVEEIKVTGRTTIRAFDRETAEKVNKECPLEIVVQGDRFVVRTNQDRAHGPNSVSSDLEITVPRGSSIEATGRYGDFDLNSIGGAVSISSDNAGVRLADIDGNARIETKRSDVVRVTNAKGNVEIRGRGNDVDLNNIGGQATVSGSYYGEISFRAVAKPVRFESSQTELRFEAVAGEVRLAHGDLSVDSVTGPVFVRASSKDVRLAGFSNAVEVDVERGDIDIRPSVAPAAPITARTRSGNVNISLPASAAFEMEGRTERGEIESFFDELKITEDGRGAKISGSKGKGPKITLETERGELGVLRAGDVLPRSMTRPAGAPEPAKAPEAAKPAVPPAKPLAVEQQ
jgi:DUF4097 and DUF4098 domain-containing protein YvlB